MDPIRDGGQLSLDFLIGVTLFLFTFMFVAQMVPTLFTPFDAQSDVTTLLADRVSVALVERYLVDDPTKPSVLNMSKLWSLVTDTATDSGKATWKAKLGLIGPRGQHDFNVSYSYGNGTTLYAGNATQASGNVGRTVRAVSGGNSTKIASQTAANWFCDPSANNNCGVAANRNWTLLQNVTAGCITGWIRLSSNWTNYLTDKGGNNKTCKDAGMTSAGTPHANVGGFRVAENTAPFHVLWQLDIEEHTTGKIDIDACDINDATHETSSSTLHKHDAASTWGYTQADSTIYISDMFTRSNVLYAAATDELSASPTLTYNLTVQNGDRLFGTYEFTNCPDTPMMVVQVW
ncbi:MAG: hypothetical protein HY558_05160 [Euryarchaeota archaeon]|nr:hypothetical protein [Euryarchaeota archaeon]